MVHWSWSPLELLELLEFVPQKKVHKDSQQQIIYFENGVIVKIYKS